MRQGSGGLAFNPLTDRSRTASSPACALLPRSSLRSHTPAEDEESHLEQSHRGGIEEDQVACASSPSSLLISGLELSDTQSLLALNTIPPRNRCTWRTWLLPPTTTDYEPLERHTEAASGRTRFIQEKLFFWLVFQAHQLLYHSTLGLRVIKKTKIF